MSAWTAKEKRNATIFGTVATTIAVTAALAGFPGFKSVNVIAIMIGIFALGALVFVVGFFGGWQKVKQIGLLLMGASTAYTLFELANPIQ